jgi:N-dimethylarginine dimethylaminohydrolase
MYSVYQHWDPLKVCVVGRSYPPEFYSWITVPHVRSLFERIAIETEEDFQKIIKKLQEFGVEVLRPELADENFIDGKFVRPPMTPRDYTVMMGHIFYEDYSSNWSRKTYNQIKGSAWPDCNSWHDFDQLPDWIKQECQEVHGFGDKKFNNCYKKILDHIRSQGNIVRSGEWVTDGAMCSRIGKDLYFGTRFYSQDQNAYYKQLIDRFPNYRNHIVNTGGHSDAVYCPVSPGLIISLRDVPTYASTFPGWEVLYLPNQSWNKIHPFIQLKEKNRGKWWIPGFEHDQDVTDTVEQWLGHWTGYVEETVFDVNMLIIDPKNVMVFNYNKQVFDTLERYGITPHVVPFRHRYFWDGGIHCVTSDLHREGTMQDYFPQRG